MARNKKNKYLQNAEKFLGKQQYEKALKEYLKAHEEDNKDVNVAKQLGDLYLKTKKTGDSIKFYKLAGSIYARDGFHQKAIAVYKQILVIDPNNYEVRLEIANLYRKLGLMAEGVLQYKEALKHFEEEDKQDKCLEIVRNLTELEPRSVSHRVKLAELYLKGGQKDQGYAEVKKAADELKSAGRWDDLVKLYEKLAKADPTNVDNLCGYGEALKEKGDFEKAQKCYVQVLKFKPDDTETLDKLVMISTRLQDVEKAVSYLRKKAKIVEEKGDEAEARLCYQKILKLYPADESAKEHLVALGETPAKVEPVAPSLDDDAIVGLPPADEEAPGTPAVEEPEIPPPPEPAPAEVEVADTEEEISDIPTADQIPGLLTEADVYIRYGLLDKAGQYIRKILRASPNMHEALNLNGLLLKEEGKIEEAVEMLLLAVEAARSKGDDDEARIYIDELLSLDPDNSDAQRHLEELNAGVEIDLGIEGDESISEEEPISEEQEVEEFLTLDDAGDVAAEDEDQLEIEGDEDEPFSFVEEAADEELVFVEDEVEEAPPPTVTPSSPTTTDEEELLFEMKDEEDAPSLEAEEELFEMEEETPPLGAEGPTLEVEEEEVTALEAEEPTLEVEEEEVTALEAEEPTLEVEEEEEVTVETAAPEADLEQEPILSEEAPIFDEIEEEEEEEEDIELEEIAGSAFDELAREASEPPAETPPLAEQPSRSLESVLDDEWGDEEEEVEEETVEEVALEAETAPDLEPAISLDAAGDFASEEVEAEKMPAETVAEAAQTSVEETLETEAALDEEDIEVGAPAEEALGAEALEEETLVEDAVAPETYLSDEEEVGATDIYAVAEAADDAWGDAIVDEGVGVEEEPAHPDIEGMAEAAEEILGEVFGDEVQPTDKSEELFDLCSVLSEDISDIAADIESQDDDLGEVLGSFRERVKEEIGEDTDTHFNLGIAYKEMGLFRDAINTFQMAMKTGYSACDCLNLIGLCFMDLNEFEKAEKIFREGLALENLQEHEILGLRFDLGMALEQQGRLEEALEAYRDVESVNPHFRDVMQVAQRVAEQVEPQETKVEASRTSRSKISYI